MKSGLIICFLLLFGVLSIQGQQIDVKEIELAIKNPESRFFYPLLLKRFNSLDTTLKKEDFKHLYYGFAFRENYFPFEMDELEKRLKDLNYAKKFEDVIDLADSIGHSVPTDLTVLFEKSYALRSLAKKEEVIVRSKYNVLLKAVLASGDGKSPETAYQVVFFGDEMEVLSALGFRILERQTILKDNRFYDVWILGKNKQKLEKLYFDVTIPHKFEEQQLIKDLKESN
ncbi:putative uncharacterized protein [Sporocytophaga myxococcoides]|uniref:DUF4919 domain-containing protein n=1 Tax=Sporocytophaga myxococcoides TaxID=153721 RepID=A0A098LLF4_9BACT|nr:DUF4919 domain-containing protein [Sporocytophaga myxococcoides]GAL87304.1 putative uncharacterized protein [Sporocytophaga myxococcoides]